MKIFELYPHTLPFHMNFEDALTSCKILGDSWRLPTKDELNEIISGSFYENELQKTSQAEGIYLVEKILQTKTEKGKKKHLVKWIGYSDKFNSWIDDKDLKHNLKDIKKL